MPAKAYVLALAANLTTATLILAAATMALVWVTRVGARKANHDAQRQIDIMREQLQALDRPLLIEVPPFGPISPDMGARPNSSPGRGNKDAATVGVQFEQGIHYEFDARSVFVGLDGDYAYVSVPLRNVGRGLAVIVGDSIDLHGNALGRVRRRGVRRLHIPVSETTRINVVSEYDHRVSSEDQYDWRLRFQYTDFVGRQLLLAQVVLQCPEGPEGPWYGVSINQ